MPAEGLNKTLPTPTFNDAVPVFPPAVAVIVTLPSDKPVAKPVSETEANPASETDQIIVPEIASPFSSFNSAENCCVSFTSIIAVCGVTVTVFINGSVSSSHPVIIKTPNKISVILFFILIHLYFYCLKF